MNSPSDMQAPAGAVRRRSRWPLRRVWAVALVTFLQGLRMRLWLLAPLAAVILIVADQSSVRYDPVFEAVPAAVGTTLFVMAVLGGLIAVFVATYSLPAEVEAKIAHTLVTKPLGRGELVAGKTLGMALLTLSLLAAVGACAYGYILILSGDLRDLAARRVEELRPRVAHPADLNALEAVARRGPLGTFRYSAADAGPDLGIHFSPDAPAPKGPWVLGETGVRLRWDLADLPLREWTASGPVQLRLALQARRAPDAAATRPVQVTVSLATSAPAHQERGRPAPTTQVTVDVPESGLVEVAVAPADAPPKPNILNVPAEGDLTLELTAVKAGDLVGAKANAVRLAGPAGQEKTLAAEPMVGAGRERGRLMLVGRSRLPRQTVEFRFAGVPEASLGAGDVGVEIGFSLDAWSPAMVPSTVEATFTNPVTGKEALFRFTPEGQRSALLYLDRDFWHGGPLDVRLECLTEEDYLGFVPASVRIRTEGGPFALHLAKATLLVGLFAAVLGAAGVLFSTRFTWFTSILGTITFFLVGSVHAWLLEATWLGWASLWLARKADGLIPWNGWRNVIGRLIVPLPDLRSMFPPESVSMGQVITGGDLAAAFGWAALAVAGLVFIGMLLLRNREVAA